MCVDGGVASRFPDFDFFADVVKAEGGGRQVGDDVAEVGNAAKMLAVFGNFGGNVTEKDAGHSVSESKAILFEFRTQRKKGIVAEKGERCAVAITYNEGFFDGFIEKKRFKIGVGAFVDAEKAAVAILPVFVGNGGKIQVIEPVGFAVARLEKYSEATFS